MAAIVPEQGNRRAARWILPTPDEGLIELLRGTLKITNLAASVLAARGFSNPGDAAGFLRPELTALHDPNQMRDMARAVERINRAIAADEQILLYGDYDVDGTSSIVILKTALELLKARVQFHVPHRLQEGYGMRSEIVDRAAREGVGLIVSVDTGIRAAAVVQRANEMGVDVIVTDHHLPDAELPPAYAVLNPNRRDCGYPEKNLCGAGVAFKLVQALFEASPLFTPERRARLLDSFLKLVAIATIADIVPLLNENRVMVRRGLAGLRQLNNAGLRALIGVAGVGKGIAPSTHQVAFQIAPRINAAGRMASARDVIDLFLTDDVDRARQLAAQLDALNRERQQAEAAIVKEILAQCTGAVVNDEAAALVFAEPGWHLGVAGIAASRLVERFSRPVFVLSDCAEDGCFSGSGRSIPGFHLLEALEDMASLFQRFGGHRQAAGLTIKRDRVPEFRDRFQRFAGLRLTPGDMRPQYTVDAAASFADLNQDTIDDVFTLAPFGFGNPAPVFMTAHAELAGPPRPMGDGKHLSVPLRHAGRVLSFKGWNLGERGPSLDEGYKRGSKLDILFTIADDPGSKARGYDGWHLALKDFRLSPL